jgi:hypothetical protein
MKNRFLLALLSVTALLAMITSCQKEDELANDQIIYRAPPPPCTPLTPTWSNNAPCAGDDLSVTFCVPATCGQAQIQWDSAGTWVQIAHENPLTGGCLTGTVPAAAAGTYNFRAQYISSGGGCNFCTLQFADTPYSVTVVECDDCELTGNTFTGTSTTTCGSSVHSATYTLCSEDGISFFHIQGGLTNFTGANATVAWVGGNGVTVSQHTPGGSSNRIVEVEGSLSECSCITITMSWNSTNANNQVTGGWSAVGFGGDLFVPVLNCNN